MRAFDKWIRKGLHQARQSRPADWEEAYDAAPTRRFLFCGERPQTPNLLLGVLRASRDKEGRTYPFVITCEIPKHDLRPRHSVQLPVQARSFYNSAERLVQRATSGQMRSTQVTDRVKDLDGVSVSPKVPREQKQYLRETTTETLSESLFGHFEHEQKYRLFSNLYETLLPSQTGIEKGLLFPLLNGEHDEGNVVSFWSELVVRVLGDESVLPTLFWTASQGPAHLLLYLGEPGPHAFVDTLLPGRSSERIVRLQEDGRQTPAEAALSIPSEYGELLEEEDVRLQDFLRQL